MRHVIDHEEMAAEKDAEITRLKASLRTAVDLILSYAHAPYVPASNREQLMKFVGAMHVKHRDLGDE